MVDHGTPIAEVNRVREQVGANLRKIQNYSESEFSTCSMERREGKLYSFNEPLLERLLMKWGEEGIREVVVALFFLLSGRHAGKGGDLVKICDHASSLFPQMKIYQTNPLAEHDIIFSILKEKLEIFHTR
jgi:sirohydrochlorin ferrochelatase